MTDPRTTALRRRFELEGAAAAVRFACTGEPRIHWVAISPHDGAAFVVYCLDEHDAEAPLLTATGDDLVEVIEQVLTDLGAVDPSGRIRFPQSLG